MDNKHIIIPIDDTLAISFPRDEEFVEETESGELSILVEIYRIDNGKHVRVKQEEVTEEMHAKTEAFINELLTQAIDYDKYEKRLKK